MVTLGANLEAKFKQDTENISKRVKLLEDHKGKSDAEIVNLVLQDQAVGRKIDEVVNDKLKEGGIEEHVDALVSGNAEIAQMKATIQEMQKEIKSLKDIPEERKVLEMERYHAGMVEYRDAVFMNKSKGVLYLVVRKAVVHTLCKVTEGVAGEQSKVELIKEKIAKIVGSEFEVFGEPRLSQKGNAVCTIHLRGKNFNATSKFMGELMKKRKELTQHNNILLSPVTPQAHNCDRTFDTWVRAGIIVKYDVNKAGFYMLFVNDGKPELRGKNREDQPTEFQAYLDSCSRIPVSNPKAIAGMRLPSVQNLRKIVKKTHFPASNGELVEYPEGYGWGAKARLNKGGAYKLSDEKMDTTNAEEDKKLLKFLQENGVEKKQGGRN